MKEYTCDRCKGKGKIKNTVIFILDGKETKIPGNDLCPKCKGSGRLNWIERIFGKK